MKKLLLLLAAIATLASCVQNIEGVDNSLGYTRITVGVPQSRTALGNKDDYGTYKIVWSEDDAIVVNGAKSTDCEINENKTSATFSFKTAVLNYPYHLTYPYTEGSACTKDNPTVVFKAEQEYVAGTFGVGNAPMCGYTEKGGVTLQHLAGVLRFALTGSATLSTIEIIAENGVALAGEFGVDCKEGTITPIEVGNKITYVANQALSEEATPFYITLPKGVEGVCQVIFTDASGLKMISKWAANGVGAGVVREFKAFEFKGGEHLSLEEMTSIQDELVLDEGEIEIHDGVWGYVKYTDGTPVVGISVSDGFSVITTNEEGFYQFVEGVNARTKHIYLSLPETAKVVMKSDNHINFFKQYLKHKSRYDFILEKIAKEEKFSLFVIADTHGATPTYKTRVEAECLGGVKREVVAKGGMPCYAVICGDIVCASTEDVTSYSYMQVKYMDDMRNMFAMSKTNNVPTFFVMGNHDHDRAYFENPIYSDVAEHNYHAQDPFEEKFGPANYSFNRGDVHIVCMRDILWPDPATLDKPSSAGCYGDFTDEQVEWLRQDLAQVPTDKKVILCVHIPLSGLYNSKPNVKTVVDMIKPYKEPQIFSGHSHINRDVKANSGNFEYGCPVSEKTVVGNWGTGSGKTENGFGLKCMGDGSPFGFDVYDVNGASFTNHYFVDCTSNLRHNVDMDYVMRAYLSSDTYGGDCNGDGTTKRGPHYFGFAKTSFLSTTHYLHVNLFNGTPDTWTLKLYINGSFAKNLTWRKDSRSNAWSDVEKLAWGGNGGQGTAEKPWYPLGQYYGYSENSQDWWYIAYEVNESTTTSAQVLSNHCHHKWDCSLTSNQLSAIQSGNFYIEATHTEFGVTRTYRTSKIFKQGDHNGYMNYKAPNN